MKFINEEIVRKKKIYYEKPVLIKIENINVASGHTYAPGSGKVAACINGSFA